MLRKEVRAKDALAYRDDMPTRKTKQKLPHVLVALFIDQSTPLSLAMMASPDSPRLLPHISRSRPE